MSLLLNAQEIELLSALNYCKARYMVIGGHAVIFHGHLRPAKDLDVWVAPNEQNAERVARALGMVSVHLQPNQIERLAKPGLQMRIAGIHIEILTSVTDLAFEQAMARSSSTIEEGVPCHVLGLADLIESKRQLARAGDLSDVQHLEAKIAG